MPERQTEYWTSTAVEHSLRDEGFVVQTLPLTPGVENKVPTDFLFAVADGSGPVKLFGLQYKALYRNGDDHWILSESQHQTITTVPWITYCLSEMRALFQQGNALHLSRFVRAGDVSPPRIEMFHRPYMRWGGFLHELRLCRVGVVVETADDVRAALRPAGQPDLPAQLQRLQVDLFIANFANRAAVHLAAALGRPDEPQ